MSSPPPLTAKQQAAIARIEALGGVVFFALDTDQQVVDSINFKGPKLKDEHLAELGSFDGYPLASLAFVGSEISAAGMNYAIASFPGLRSFTAMNVAVGDELAPALAECRQLQALNLPQTGVTSAGLECLDDLRALTQLDLAETAVDDRGLEHVANLRELWWLNLGNTAATSAGLRHLFNLQKLDTLLLHKTQVGDDGMACIAPLKNLKVLRLDDTQVTDRGLAHLKDLPTLKSLILDGTAVTDAGLAKLQQMSMLEEVGLKRTQVTQLGRDRFILYLPVNEQRGRALREQFERCDWPPKRN